MARVGVVLEPIGRTAHTSILPRPGAVRVQAPSPALLEQVHRARRQRPDHTGLRPLPGEEEHPLLPLPRRLELGGVPERVAGLGEGGAEGEVGPVSYTHLTLPTSD